MNTKDVITDAMVDAYAVDETIAAGTQDWKAAKLLLVAGAEAAAKALGAPLTPGEMNDNGTWKR